jgi:hypothetical protein
MTRASFEALDPPEHLVLDVARQTGRDAVDVDLQRVAALGFQEQLVAVLVGEPHDLVFDRRAVAGAAGADLAAVHRRAVQVAADQVVDLLVGVGDPAGNLLDRQLAGQKGKRRGRIVAGLDLQTAEVDTVRPFRRAGVPVLKRSTRNPAAAGLC